jgi:hypothetical protein
VTELKRSSRPLMTLVTRSKSVMALLRLRLSPAERSPCLTLRNSSTK